MNKQLRIVSEDILTRHFVGFDRMFDRFSSVQTNSYPPHNVVKTGEDTRDIEFALAGFAEDDISVVVEDGVLTVSGSQKPDEDSDREYLWRGIGTRAFTKQFSLSEYWEVIGAKFTNGILVISTRQEVPESVKPKTIKIKS